MAMLPRRLRDIPDPVISLNGHPLEFVDEFPYLEHLIKKKENQKDNDTDHRQCNLCSVGNMITRRFGPETKLTLFRTYCYNIYGGALWVDYTQESIRRTPM